MPSTQQKWLWKAAPAPLFWVPAPARTAATVVQVVAINKRLRRMPVSLAGGEG